MKKLIPLLLSLILASCSFSSDEEVHEKGVYPMMVLRGARYTLGQSGENPIFIESAEMAVYEDSRATVKEITFISYGDDGEAALEGKADSGEIDTDKKTMNLSGNVSLRRSEGNMEIEADTLYFDSAEDIIEAGGRVYVSSDDGVFTGTGFRGDLREDAYSFTSIEKGEFTI